MNVARPSVAVRRVYEPPSADDGHRVLVDRLWPRGLRRDELSLDEWLPRIAPSADLRRWFGHDPSRWERFRERYRSELDACGDELERLAAIARHDRLTLLFGARDQVHNQAVVLRDVIVERLAAPPEN